MAARLATKARPEAEEEGHELAAPTLNLTLIEDLEAQLAQAVGEDRRPLRRKLRAARKGAGVPMTRLRSTAGGSRRTKASLSARIEGEEPEAARKRLAGALREAGAKLVPVLTEGFGYPLCYPAETLLAKYEHLIEEKPTKFAWVNGLVVLA